MMLELSNFFMSKITQLLGFPLDLFVEQHIHDMMIITISYSANFQKPKESCKQNKKVKI